MRQLGDPHEIARAYHKLNFGKLPHEAPAPGALGRGTAIADAWFEDAAGERIARPRQEEPLRMCFEVRFAEDLDDPVFAATLRTELGHTIVVARSDERGASERLVPRGRDAVVRFEMPNWLTPSRYLLTPSVARAGTGEDAVALVEDMTSIVVHGNSSGGILELPLETKIERS